MNQETQKRIYVFPDSWLTVTCEITILRVNIIHPIDEKHNNVLELNNMEYPCKSKSLLTDSEKCFNNEEFSDVKSVIDGKDFYAHKNILAYRSQVFAAMFKQHEMKENLQNIIEIEDIRYEVLNEMLHFMQYAGRFEEIRKVHISLFIVANK